MADAQLSSGHSTFLDNIFAPSTVIPAYSISRGVDGVLHFDPPVQDEKLAIALSYHFPLEMTLKAKVQAAILEFLQRSPDVANPAVEISMAEPQNENAYQEHSMLMARWAQPQTVTSLNPSLTLGTGNGFLEAQLQAAPHLVYDVENHPTASTETNATSIEDECTTPNPTNTVQALVPWAWDSKTGLIKTKIAKRKYGTLEAKQVFNNRGNASERHRRTKSKCDPMKCTKNKQFRSPCSSSSLASLPRVLSEYLAEKDNFRRLIWIIEQLSPMLVVGLKTPTLYQPRLNLPPLGSGGLQERKRKASADKSNHPDNDENDDSASGEGNTGGSGGGDFDYNFAPDDFHMDGPSDDGGFGDSWGSSGFEPDYSHWQAAYFLVEQLFAFAAVRSALSVQRSVARVQGSRKNGPFGQTGFKLVLHRRDMIRLGSPSGERLLLQMPFKDNLRLEAHQVAVC